MLYRELDKKYGLNSLFDIDLNSQHYLKQAFPAKAILMLQEPLDLMIDKISKDSRIENRVLIGERKEIFKKNTTRFLLYVIVSNYSQLLRYLQEFLGYIKRSELPMDLLVEYALFLAVRVEKWAVEGFGLNAMEAEFYRKKISSILFLLTKVENGEIITFLDELLDSMPSTTPVAVQRVEIELFSFLADPITDKSMPKLIELTKRYLAAIKMTSQKGSDKISSLLAKTVQFFEQGNGQFAANRNSNIYISDLIEKFAFYTSDSEFEQASLALHYLDIQIELTLLRAFLQTK